MKLLKIVFILLLDFTFSVELQLGAIGNKSQGCFDSIEML